MSAETTRGKEVVGVEWNPRSAFIMHLRAQRERGQIKGITAALERVPDLANSSRINPTEHIAWLSQQAELAEAGVVKLGGHTAVEAFQARMEDSDFYPDGTPVNPELRPRMAPLPVPTPEQ